MASKPQAASKRLIEPFEPTFEWIRDASSHTLAVNLPGFKKEELKIQIDNFGKLRVTGERALGDNKWRQFVKDFQTPTDCKLNMIKAKFEKDKLYVSMPKNVEAIQQDQLAPTQEAAAAATKTPTVPPVSAPTTKPVTSATPTAKTIPAKPVTAPTTTKITPTIPTTSVQPVAGKTMVSAADKEKEKSSGSSLAAEKTTNETLKKENGKSGASIVAGGVTQQVPIKEMADAEKRKMEEDETTDGKASLENQPSVMGRLALGLKKPRSLALRILVAVVVTVVLGIYVNNRLRASSQDLED